MTVPTIPSGLTLPPRTVVGRGCARGLPGACREHGPRGLIVCSRSVERAGGLAHILDGIAADDDTILIHGHSGGEPTLAQVEDLRSVARHHRPDWIAAVGGGSVLDVAKAAAGLYAAPEPVQAYHDGAPIPPSSMPFAAAPSTAGTGSEATTVSVLTNETTGVKKSIRQASFMPQTVWLDADLLDSCPPRVIAHSGMDALTQAVESCLSRHATWFTDQLSMKAIRLIHGSLMAVFSGDKAANAENLLMGSYLAGLALANARLGLVHGLAHPLGARYHTPHGHVCAICLPSVLEFNMVAARDKIEELSEHLGLDLLTAVHQLISDLGITNPFAGEALPDRDAIIAETLASGSTKANPRAVTPDDIARILDALFAAD